MIRLRLSRNRLRRRNRCRNCPRAGQRAMLRVAPFRGLNLIDPLDGGAVTCDPQPQHRLSVVFTVTESPAVMRVAQERVDIQEYARRLVADWPPLTDAQRAALVVLLNPATTSVRVVVGSAACATGSDLATFRATAYGQVSRDR